MVESPDDTRSLPATRYGYRPPIGAMAVGWICLGTGCWRTENEPDRHRWPYRCPDCGGRIATGRLRQPWQHAAKRVEIDARLREPRDDGDREQAGAEDLVWRVEEAFRTGRADLADVYRHRLDAFILDARARSTYFSSGTYRRIVVCSALAHGAVDMAARELVHWNSVIILSNLDGDEARRDNCRHLATQMIAFLEDPYGAASPSAPEVWTMLMELTPRMSDVMTNDHTAGIARLKGEYAGGGRQERALIAVLTRLRGTANGRYPIDGLPAETPIRMEAFGKHSYDPRDSGIDSAMIWDACLEPYRDACRREPARLAADLAAAVLRLGGWPIVGAARCLQEFDERPVLTDPNMLLLIDEELLFLRRRGAPADRLRPLEWRRWSATHGAGNW